jgi:hypothetical protein
MKAKKKLKKDAEVVVSPEAVPEVQAEAVDDTKRLTRAEMLELRCLEAESKLASAGIQNITMQRDQLLAKLDPEGKILALSGTIRGLADDAARLAREQIRLKGEIEKRLGIDNLANYSYDDMSGDLKIPD